MNKADLVLKERALMITRFFVRRIVNRWVEKTRDWGKDEWINYLNEEFDKLKRTKWTKRFFPELEHMKYDDLINYKVIREYPSSPPDYPAFMEWKSSGTVKRKIIRFSRGDALKMLRAAGRYLFDMGIGYSTKNALAIYTSEEFATSKIFLITTEMFAKKRFLASLLRLHEQEGEIVNHAPYDAVTGLLGFIWYVFEKIVSKHDILSDITNLITTGESLTPSVINSLKEIAEKWGKEIKIFNGYGCAEGGLIAGSLYQGKYYELLYYPDFVGLMILTQENELVNIFDAKIGTIGETIITLLKDMVVPNYALGDLIEVVGKNSKGIPIIRVLGRKAKRVRVKLPEFGEVEGLVGGILRIASIDFNTFAWEEALSNLTKDYFILVHDYRSYAKMLIYTSTPFEKEELFKELSKDPLQHALAKMIEREIIKLEIIHDPELTSKLALAIEQAVLEDRSPKIPRILLVRGD